MTSDVVLSAAMRTNLLSLQNTQSLVDITQNRLATGKKINSALDGPQAFFASQALGNRAGDLSRLLDSIGQSIQVIKAADNGITALTKLVEQADSVAAAARDALAQGQVEAKIKGSGDLRNIDDLTGLPGITAGDTLVFAITDEDGNPVNLGAYGAVSTATATVTIDALDSTNEIIAEINNLHIDDGAGNANGDQAFEAKLDEAGHLQIRTLNGGDFTIRFEAIAVDPDDADDLSLAQSLGFGDMVELIPDGAGTNTVEFSSLADVALRSFKLYSNTSVPPHVAQASDLLDTITDSSGLTARFANIDNAADQYIISVDGGTQQAIDLWDGANPISIQRFVDAINTNTALNTKIKASYDDETGELSIRPIDGSVKDITVGVTGDDAVEANFGFGLRNLVAGAAGEQINESLRLAASAADLASLESDFNNLRDQMTQLVTNGDTAYRGTNLLNGDDLLTIFNEFRTSSLTTNGVAFTADGLGLDEADFSRIDSTEGVITQVREALETVRNFGATLANDLSIIQARQEYTTNIINTLKEGSALLVNADQNEEGAKLLALQTRQSLGVTALSLASQSQQSILRLFG